jgi:hypothetical protein
MRAHAEKHGPPFSHAGKIPLHGLLSALLLQTLARRRPAHDGFAISGYKAERAGAWFAPWGPLIPAGGRLLLAIA